MKNSHFSEKSQRPLVYYHELVFFHGSKMDSDGNFESIVQKNGLRSGNNTCSVVY